MVLGLYVAAKVFQIDIGGITSRQGNDEGDFQRNSTNAGRHLALKNKYEQSSPVSHDAHIRRDSIYRMQCDEH